MSGLGRIFTQIFRATARPQDKKKLRTEQTLNSSKWARARCLTELFTLLSLLPLVYFVSVYFFLVPPLLPLDEEDAKEKRNLHE